MMCWCLFTLLDTPEFVAFYLCASSFYNIASSVICCLYIFFTNISQHRTQCLDLLFHPIIDPHIQAPFDPLVMVPVHYGVFSNTYTLNIWWTKLLQISTMSGYTLLQFMINPRILQVPIIFELLITNYIIPQDRPPELIAGLIWLGSCFTTYSFLLFMVVCS